MLLHGTTTITATLPQPLLILRSAPLKMRTLMPLPTSTSQPLFLPLLKPPTFSFSLPKPKNHRNIFTFKPCSSSLKETKKQTLPKSSKPPFSLKWLGSSNKDDSEGPKEDGVGGLGGETAITGTILAGLLLVGVVGGFGSVGYIYRDQINDFLIQLTTFIEGNGPSGYALFVAVYAGLEVAATVAFLIARYFARERILKMVEGNKKFLAIDKAIGENGFKVVTLLRLSPLLPFSLGNYLYGLTSVRFVPYVLGSWLGMLPGTWAYVSAGAFGRAIIQEESNAGLVGGNNQLLTLGLGLLATGFAATYVTRIAKDSVKDIE